MRRKRRARRRVPRKRDRFELTALSGRVFIAYAFTLEEAFTRVPKTEPIKSWEIVPLDLRVGYHDEPAATGM